jgi:tricorn protease
MRFPFARFALVLALTLFAASAAQAAKGYLSFPDIHGDRIVFCAEDDLWTCSAQGGDAQRLTTHVGREYFPRFSPDGRWIAFTGQYEGNRDVYVMPVGGGEPRRLTWHPASDSVIEWTPDGKSVIFRSWRDDPNFTSHLYTVPLDGGDVEQLPIGWAYRIDMDPDSGLWAFNRLSREGATWKRYRGGTAPDLWVGDPVKEDYRAVTDFDGNDDHPMWHGGRLYFLSDMGGTGDIWSILPDGSDRKRHTDGGDWDARWPGMGPSGRIVYMSAGGLRLYDPDRDRDGALDIELPSERNLARHRYADPGRYLSAFDITPDGKRLAVVTRGEIFSVPVEEGVTLPVTKGSGARETYVSFGPEGERILYVTDASREEALETADAWGRGDVKTVREVKDAGYHFPPTWSPDGERIAYADEDFGLFVVPAKGGKSKLVDRSERWLIRQYAWSPDGRWLAYTKILPNDFGSIFLYDTQTEKTHQVTGTYTDDGSPAWDPDGRYLFFLSQRTANPMLGNRDYTFVEARNSKPYLLLLKADAEHPFVKREGLPPTDDEEDEAEKEDEDDDEEGEEEDEDELAPVEIDLEGLAERVVELPVPVGRYSSLAATADKLFYVSWPLRGWAEEPEGMGEAPIDNELMIFDMADEEAETFMSGVRGYALALEAGKLAVMKGRGELYVVGADSPPSDLGESAVSLDGIVLELDPREEWEQIYYEAWRRMRDRFWDEGMSGVDWKKMRDQYARLLPLLATRGDLRDLLGELIGELNTGHTYVWGGDDAVSVPRASTGLLGADLSREGEAFRVERIYRGDPADNATSPLLVPGVNVSEGDYLLAVNGIPFAAERSLFASFANLAGKEVLLSVAADAKGEEERRDVVVTPLGLDNGLRYADWVRRNREYVSEKTDGKIGYVHIPDMGQRGLMQFSTWFFPQLNKEGMVVDVRWNGGGFVSSMIVERLRRPVTAFGRTRQGRVDPYPEIQLNGPFVVLTNEFAGSDGDIFPRAVQLEQLAPVIGMRSWGGVIGINMSHRLVDRGMVTYPFAAWWDDDWGWDLENRGVEPDIVVPSLPQELAHGIDSQLERGIAEVLKLHKEQPPVVPSFEKAKDKSRKAYRRER